MKKTLVFVYGSLKKGYGNHCILGDSTFIGDHVTDEKYTMLSMGAFPCVDDGGTTPIHGEVYAVTDEILNNLDLLEGCPRFFKQKKLSSVYGEIVMYVINKECLVGVVYPVIKSGIWENPWEMEEVYDIDQELEYDDDEDSYNVRHRCEY
jgi:gamma-glutamylcyclotransferase (GGCT)/AIG2-like uncharacterized protein YtfP